MNNQGPNVPMPMAAPRRHGDYQYFVPAAHQHHPPAYHVPYYHPSQYNAHAPPPMHNPYNMQPYYQPYPQYVPPPPRQFHPQGPFVMPPQQYIPQHPPPMNRQTSYPPPPPPQPPLPTRTPQPEPSTPSVTSQPVVSPSPSKSTSISTTTPPIQVPKTAPSTTAPTSPTVQTSPSSKRMPFYPTLPWYSVPESPFPPRIPRRRRKRAELSSDQLELPDRQQSKPPTTEPAGAEESRGAEEPRGAEETVKPDIQVPVEAPEAEKPEPATPSESVAPSEAESTNPTTPSSSVTATASPIPQAHKRTATKGAIVPIVPIKPVVPLKSGSPVQPRTTSAAPEVGTTTDESANKQTIPEADVQQDATTAEAVTEDAVEAVPVPTSPAPKAAPPSWAALFAGKAAAAASAASGPTAANAFLPNGNSMPKAGNLAEALRSYSVEEDDKVSFLEPRGLVNTGNMCYMNSILQVLVFCMPFFTFLDQVGKRAVHSFKSDTPLIEAMIMFMREFNVIDSAANVNQLRLRLKDNELEKYGEAFIPEYVYDVIKRLPRFSSMRRGHQQDAEEFLGFLLEGLHDECVHVIKQQGVPDDMKVTSPPTDAPDGWMEVGHKQKAAVTHSSGSVSESPVTKIFGGQLRSEFRVPGLQTSVTLEPYQPLQLDIGAPDIHNIVDALKGLTRSETITGDFKSPRGATTATKQVFIETLPPVLILHLKRFQYDNTGGTQKIWKKIGYPLELEIPKEVFPPHRRGALTARPQGLPKYRLISVVYHHGKNASGGHYTVDVRRQEGREWIRLDDTVIRRVRSEDVASEGGEEDPKVLAKALEQHKRDSEDAAKNMYAGFGDEVEEDDDKGWSQVNGNTKDSTKKWSNVATTTNGTATPSTVGKQTPKALDKYSLKDNKTPYLLFYSKISD